jgi:hypothetical protein
MFFLVYIIIVFHINGIRVPDHWEPKFGIVELFGSIPGYEAKSISRTYSRKIG